jgi:hypothetical protein
MIAHALKATETEGSGMMWSGVIAIDHSVIMDPPIFCVAVSSGP